jgi:hypothetical protein
MYVRVGAVECRRVAAVSTAERVAYEMGTACYSSTTVTATTGKVIEGMTLYESIYSASGVYKLIPLTYIVIKLYARPVATQQQVNVHVCMYT